jgi:selenocysteine-specific elongation factor
MTIVIGTAGHIDHGKTRLLRALTGIDADRLPEERRRGMTIDVGYAHMALPDGTEVDFVDVPGHDRLVGNMLVGAGEIDAVMLVVAADDGPRAQTIEHLELLDALGIRIGVVAVAKTDLVRPERAAEVQEAVRVLVASTSLAGSPIVGVSSHTGEGLDDLRTAVVALRDRVRLDEPDWPRLAIDRVFAVKGRGTVVTGTLRGVVAAGDQLRVAPGDRSVRVREVQVHGRKVDRSTGGRTAFNLAATDAGALRRGMMLTADPAVEATDRILVALRPSVAVAQMPTPGRRLRLHVGTESVDAVVGRGTREWADLPDGGRVVALRLERPIAVASGDRFALRQPSPAATAGGGIVIDPRPPRGPSRRRMTGDRLVALARAGVGDRQARLDLHGALDRRLAADVREALERAAIGEVREHHGAEPASGGLATAALRSALIRDLRRLVSIDRDQAGHAVAEAVDRLVDAGQLERTGDRVRLPGSSGSSELAAAMDRLEVLLSVPAPPPLAEAARTAGCPADGIRALQEAGRIIRVEDDLAWAASMHADLTDRALALADAGPLTPAALRDATGTSRRYVLAILEDLDRRGVLRRTPDGHVRGPRAPVRAGVP